jgi:hypothetical protein
MQISVKSLKGDTLALNVEPTMLVSDIKKMIIDKLGVTHVKLIHAGKEMKNEKRLNEYHVRGSTTLHVITSSRYENSNTENKTTSLQEPEKKSQSNATSANTSSLSTTPAQKLVIKKENTALLWMVENKDPVSINFKQKPEICTFFYTFDAALEAFDIRDKKNKHSYVAAFNCTLIETNEVPTQESLEKSKASYPAIYRCHSNYYLYSLDKEDNLVVTHLPAETAKLLESCKLPFSSKPTSVKLSQSENKHVYDIIFSYHNFYRKVSIKAVELTIPKNAQNKSNHQQSQRFSDYSNVADAIVYSTRDYNDWDSTPPPLDFEILPIHFDQGSHSLKDDTPHHQAGEDPRLDHFYAQIAEYSKLMPPSQFFELDSFDPNKPVVAKKLEFSTEHSNSIKFEGNTNNNLAFMSIFGPELCAAIGDAYLKGQFRKAVFLDGIDFIPNTAEPKKYNLIQLNFSLEAFPTSESEKTFIKKIEKLVEKHFTQQQTQINLISTNPEVIQNFLKSKIISSHGDLAKNAESFVEELIQLLIKLEPKKELKERSETKETKPLPKIKEEITEKLFAMSWDTPREQNLLNGLLDKLGEAKTLSALQDALKFEKLPQSVKDLANDLDKTETPKYYSQSPNVQTQFSPSSASSRPPASNEQPQPYQQEHKWF